MQFPDMIRVRQHFEAPCEQDCAGAMGQALDRLELRRRVSPGQSVAISCGSRGIANIAAITRAMVDYFKAMGAKPFIFPCMGSHGNATAEGQVQVLADYGITKQTMEAPVRATMESHLIDELDDGTPVYLDCEAAEADHIVVANMIKPHPCYSAPVESGLMKMMMIGFGNHIGAKLYHQRIMRLGFRETIYPVAESMLEHSPVLCGVAIHENADQETAGIHAVLPENLVEEEAKLQTRAKKLMPRLPFADIDVLIVDRIGKDLSGSGMDSNVVGRGKDIGVNIKHIIVRSLTPASHGNASGIGWADFAHARAVEQMDLESSYVNAITSGYVDSVAIPVHFNSDRRVLEAAMQSQGKMQDPSQARIVWIRDTRNMREVGISTALAREAEERDDLTPVGEPTPLAFDSQGNLEPFFGPVWE